MNNHDAPQGPVARLAGKHYWVSDEYSVPADNLCWNNAPEPNRDCLCVRDLNHLGRCKFVYSPLIRDYSWKEGVL
jgi:hypothetical protein